jgi:hypothetical protein
MSTNRDVIDGLFDINATSFDAENDQNVSKASAAIPYQCYDNGTLVVPLQVLKFVFWLYFGSLKKALIK